MRWTRKGIVEEIRRMKSAGKELNYSAIEREHLNLARAAAWHFGNWRGAVEAAGIDYESVGKYRRWNRERVVARIRELHQSGADLNWRAVSTCVDPPLAAAALRVNGFANWREAIAAAGLQIETVSRYRRWDDERVIAAVREMQKRGETVTSKAVQSRDQPLFCAARRRFGSWDETLQRAGILAQRRRSSVAKKSATSDTAPPLAAARVLAPREKTHSKSVAGKDAGAKSSAPRAKAAKESAAKIAPAAKTKSSAPRRETSQTPLLQKSTVSTRGIKSAAPTTRDAKSGAKKAGVSATRSAKATAQSRAPENTAPKTHAAKIGVSKTSAAKTTSAKTNKAKSRVDTSGANKTSVKISGAKNGVAKSRKA